MRRFYALSWTAFLFVFALASSGEQLAERQSWEMPFRLYNGFVIMLRGSIADLEDCNLVIDTGTSPTIVDQQVVRRLHIASSRSRLSVASGEVASAQAVIPRIEVGPLVKQNVVAAVKDLAAMSNKFHVHIDALVGLDVLAGANLSIDYEHRVLAFGDSVLQAANTASFEPGYSFVVVPLSLNRKAIHVAVDTGAFGLVLFENHLGQTVSNVVHSAGEFQGIEGDIDMKEAEQVVSVGRTELGARHVFLAKGPKTARFDGLLGVSGLGASRVSFDFQHGQFSWR
jgi:hypothetical protein